MCGVKSFGHCNSHVVHASSLSECWCLADWWEEVRVTPWIRVDPVYASECIYSPKTLMAVWGPRWALDVRSMTLLLVGDPIISP